MLSPAVHEAEHENIFKGFFALWVSFLELEIAFDKDGYFVADGHSNKIKILFRQGLLKVHISYFALL